MREMLRQLVCYGYDVEVIGATVFDAEIGMSILPENWKRGLEKTDILELLDTPLVHKLLMTKSHKRDAMTALEEAKWYEFYLHTLDTFQPDLVWFYGGRPLDYLISDEARHRGISVAAIVVQIAMQLEKPYTRLLEPELLDLFVKRIIEFYDNESWYTDYAVRAREAGEALHNIDNSAGKLVEAFNSLISVNI